LTFIFTPFSSFSRKITEGRRNRKDKKEIVWKMIKAEVDFLFVFFFFVKEKPLSFVERDKNSLV
jgi:hypothetical protein